MKKRICALCMCMLLVLSFGLVSAQEIPVVTTADGIEMSSLTYEDEALAPKTDITVKLTAKRTEATENADKFILVASLMNDGVMTAVDTDSKELGTEATEFEATLTLPEDISKAEITVALLKQTETGLVPVGSSSYRPGKEDFLPIKSATLADKELEFDENNITKVVLAPKAADVPEGLKVETADTATKIDWTVYSGENTFGEITASLPDGDAIVYTVNFENATHYFAKAKTDDDFTFDNSYSEWNMVSKDVVTNAASSYKPSNMPDTFNGVVNADYIGKAFTNLHGEDPDYPNNGGSRLFTNYPAGQSKLSQRHAIDYVDPYYEGCDYFITSNGSMTTDQSVIYYDFDLAYDAEVSIITLSKCNSYPKDGWSETTNTSTGFLVAHYLNLTLTTPMYNVFGVTPTYTEANTFNKAANNKEGTSQEYLDACDVLAASISERTGMEITGQQIADAKVGWHLKDSSITKIQNSIGNTFKYQYAYTKKFTVADGEESVNVKIKAPDTAQARGFVVVIKPIEE